MKLLMSKRRIMLNNLHAETRTETGDVVTFNTDVIAPFKNLIANFSPVQSGSGDPSPTNIRPITGWTGCNVYDDAKYGGLINWNQKFPALSVTKTFPADSTYYYGDIGNIGSNVAVTNGHKYYMALNTSRSISNNNALTILLGGQNSEFSARILDGESDGWKYKIVSCQATSTFTKFSYNNYSGKKGFNAGDSMSITGGVLCDLTQLFGETKADEIYAMEQTEAGSGVAYFKSLFPKDYYEYNAGTETTVGAVNGDDYRHVEVDWTDDAGTVYGGYIDVVKGTLTATYGYVDLGSLTWEKISSERLDVGYDFGSSSISRMPAGYNDKICDHYWIVPINGLTNIISQYGRAIDKIMFLNAAQTKVYVIDSTYTDAEEFETAMSGVYLVYKLKTPITYDLTPETIRSLRGTNNVWTDTNEDTSVTYVSGVTQSVYWTN